MLCIQSITKKNESRIAKNPADGGCFAAARYAQHFSSVNS
jgi:hypothetical protein